MQPNVCAIQKVKGDMVEPPPPKADGKPPRRQNALPPEVLDIIWPALQVGGLSGMFLNLIWHVPDGHQAPFSALPFAVQIFARDCISGNVEY